MTIRRAPTRSAARATDATPWMFTSSANGSLLSQADDRDEVVDDLDAVERDGHCVLVEDVDRLPSERSLRTLGDSGRKRPRHPVDRHDIMALPQQCGDKVETQEPGSAGDSNLHQETLE